MSFLLRSEEEACKGLEITGHQPVVGRNRSAPSNRRDHVEREGQMPTFEMEDTDFAGYLEDDSIVTATVVAVKTVEKPYKDDDGNPVKRVEFKFSISDGSAHDGTNVWGDTSTKFVQHPECRLRNWSQAILGQELGVGYRLDTDLLVGHDCRINVGLKQYEQNGQPKQRNFVKDVIPSAAAINAMRAAPDEEPF